MALPVLVALAGRGVHAPRARVVLRAGALRAIQPGTPLTVSAVVTMATGQSSAWSLPHGQPVGQHALRPGQGLIAAAGRRPPLAAVLIWFGVTRDLGSVTDPSPRTIGG